MAVELMPWCIPGVCIACWGTQQDRPEGAQAPVDSSDR